MAYTEAELAEKFKADPETYAQWNAATPEEKQRILGLYNNEQSGSVTVGSSPVAGIIPTALAGKGLYDLASSSGRVGSSLVETPNVISASRVPSSPVEMGMGDYVPGIAGTVGLYDLFKNKPSGLPGALQGTASGAGVGYTVGNMVAPGVGGGIGAGIGGAIGLGAGLLNAHKSTKQREAERWSATGKQGVAPGHDYFAGTGGEQSRDESFLTPDAIRMNPDNYNNVPDWDSWSKDKQDKFLSTMLAEKKVTERKGGIYYDDARAKQLAAEIGAEPDAAPATSAPRTENRREDKKNPFKTPYQPGVTLQDLLPTVDIPKPVGDPGNAIASYAPKTFSELYDEQVKKRRGTYGQI